MFKYLEAGINSYIAFQDTVKEDFQLPEIERM